MSLSIDVHPMIAASLAAEAAALNIGMGEIIERALWTYLTRGPSLTLDEARQSEPVIQF